MYPVFPLWISIPCIGDLSALRAPTVLPSTGFPNHQTQNNLFLIHMKCPLHQPKKCQKNTFFIVWLTLKLLNKFPLHLTTFGTYWLQELPVNHTQSSKITVEILILYLECQWRPYKSIIFSEY